MFKTMAKFEKQIVTLFKTISSSFYRKEKEKQRNRRNKY